MRVALVFNLKKEKTDDSSGDDSFSSVKFLNKLSAEQKEEIIDDTYAEWDTWETINAVKLALEENHTVTLIEADENSFEKLRRTKPDIVFNIAEGFHGASREAQIPAILEMLNIPYTGSDPLTLAICLDKARTKEILSYHKIPTAKFIVVENLDEFDGDIELEFPLIVKPLHEGSSKGIFNSSVVENRKELLFEIERILNTYNEPALIEEFLPGREFTVAILGNGKDARVLPIIEIKFDSLPPEAKPIYSFEAKWIWDTPQKPLNIFQCPAEIDKKLKETIEKIALSTFKILRCRDWCRIDMRLDKNGIPNILEVNPLPGILPNPEDNSCFPKAARAAGLTYNQMINEVLNSALKRYGMI
ncbi:D-alanine--D-alanine ligase family protein [Candidatus Kryptobacter tengchongensis]|uniref:D-alanine--D-alanine ligase family protein n=1 Tax=Kryptobacter tengchongensis TaxID=1643429 RepID=UPI0007077AB4|nr:ATP-grasp domain-containing protein [Candidatus Kryptobacter tengchongensis]CUS87908.1 D-alanine-D-alanine ligase [Candidatus Kryptobacter tengchongensis]